VVNRVEVLAVRALKYGRTTIGRASMDGIQVGKPSSLAHRTGWSGDHAQH
jgi:hypothetical protein